MESPNASESDSQICGKDKLFSDASSPLRRGRRPRTKPKALKDFLEHTNRKTVQVVSSSSGTDSELDMCKQKVSSLLINEDVEGQDIFKFRSRHSKLGLQNKVDSAVNSPRTLDLTPKTPRRSRMSMDKKTSEATPKHVRDVIKKRIMTAIESDEINSDYSGSSSDFIPEISGEESSASSQSEDAEEESPERPRAAKLPLRRVDTRNKLKRDTDYVVTPDSYFMMNQGKKNSTSDHTLERLKNYNPSDIQSDIENLTDEHKTKIASLIQSHEQLFNRWLYVLSENYSIILYGVGSKREILQKFQAKKLKDFPCVVVNGFFPSLTIKNVLEAIVVDLLECSQVPSNMRDAICLIEQKLKEQGTELFLIIHNIDGGMLQNSKSQAILANLSQIKHIHTIASIDHINAPLIWDHKRLSQFSFTWWDVTTFTAYSAETSFETSLTSRGGGALQLASLHSVYRSLTTNAKKVFAVIVEHQLKNHKTVNYPGISFRDLYSKCREQFVVSCDAGLRAQLTEFLDHKLVTSRRSDGDCLLVPIDNALLQHFMDTVDC